MTVVQTEKSDTHLRRTIKHCERWIVILDFMLGMACTFMVSAVITYYAIDFAFKHFVLFITWVWLAILAATLAAQIVTTRVMNNARYDLFAGGEESFDDHVNRLMDKRERHNKLM